MNKYFLLVGSLYFVVITVVMYFKMPKYRKPMVIMGLSLFWAGPLADYLWFTKDWWHPPTITGTVEGPESFIISFTNMVVAMFIYKLAFRKDTDGDFQMSKEAAINAAGRIMLWFIFPLIVIAILFQIFHLNSVISTITGLLLSGAVILIKRQDLWRAMLWTPFLMMVITIPGYLILNFLFPGSFEEIWYFSKLTGITLLGIPFEDLLFYFLVGFSMGAAYEYVFDFRLIDRKS